VRLSIVSDKTNGRMFSIQGRIEETENTIPRNFL